MPEESTRAQRRYAGLTAATPLLLGVAGAITALRLARTGDPLGDPDVWWHIRTGRLILDKHAIPHTDPFSFTAAPDSWVPTAWLSDVAFAGVWHALGFEGIRVLRVVMAALVVLATWRFARRFATTEHAGLGAAIIAVLALAPFLAERPQVLSYFFVVWLSSQLVQVLDGRPPSLWRTTAVTWVWANLHGMWFILPVFLVIAGVLAWFQDRRRVPLAARCTLVAIVSVAAAALTPVGPRLAIWPVVVSHVAAPINEWAPTQPLSLIGLPLFLTLGIIVLAWARSSRPIALGTVLFVGVVGVFGLSAFRNVAPATLLLLPYLARAISTLLPQEDAVLRRRSRWLTAAIGVASLAGALVHMLTSPTIAPGEPLRIAAALRDRKPPARVLNSYNVGGFLTGLATPGAKVGIDGRTDMWSASYVVDYLEAVSGRRDWRRLVDKLDPTAAVLPEENQVAAGLIRERGWRVVMVDHGWLLLEPP